MLEVYPPLLEVPETGNEGRPEPAVSIFPGVPKLAYLACEECNGLDLQWPHESRSIHKSQASLLSTQKNRKNEQALLKNSPEILNRCPA